MYTFRPLIIIVLASLIGCQYLPWGKKEAETIYIGEPTTIVVTPPEDAFDVSYQWTLLDLPDESLLIPDFSSSSNVFTFIPDVMGDYEFSIIVESYGEEVEEYTRRFTAVEDTSLIRQQGVPDRPTTPQPRTTLSEPVTPSAAARDLQRQLETATRAAPSTPPPSTSARPKKPARTTTAAAPARKPDPDVVPGHFTIQISSWKTAKHAQTVLQNLIDLGYDAYIQRIWLEDKNETWWRVRVGDFESLTEAKKVLETIQESFPEAWLDNVRLDNVVGE